MQLFPFLVGLIYLAIPAVAVAMERGTMGAWCIVIAGLVLVVASYVGVLCSKVQPPAEGE